MTIKKIPDIYSKIDHQSFPADLMKIAGDIGEKTAFACLNNKYASWVYLLNYSGVKKVLVFDSMVGLDSVALSKFVNSVVVASVDKNMTKILLDRFNHGNIKNITVVEVGEVELLQDHSFDLIVCRDTSLLVSFFREKNVAAICSHVEGLLSAQGRLLLGYNKRPILTFFKPSVLFTDEKNQIFSRLFNTLSKRKFTVCDTFFCLPEQHYFDEIVSKKFLPDFPSDAISLKIKIKHLIIKKLYPIASPNVNYLLSKSTPEKPLLESLIEKALQINQGSVETLKIQRLFVGNPNTLVVVVEYEETGYIVRFPMCDNSETRVLNQYKVLDSLHRKNIANTHKIPKVFAPFIEKKQKVFVEEKFSGEVLDDTHLLSVAAEEAAVEWLIGFHSETKDYRKISTQELESLVSSPCSVLKQYLKKDSEKKILESLCCKCISEFKNKDRFLFVCMHGDFKIENMLFSSDHKTVTGVFDWDLSLLSGLPLVDLLYFFAYSRKLKGETLSIPEIFSKMFLFNSLSMWERKQIDRYLDTFSLSPDDLKLYSFLAWLYHVVYRMDVSSSRSFNSYYSTIGSFLISSSGRCG